MTDTMTGSRKVELMKRTPVTVWTFVYMGNIFESNIFKSGSTQRWCRDFKMEGTKICTPAYSKCMGGEQQMSVSNTLKFAVWLSH